MRSQEELVNIAQSVADGIMDNWFREYGSWDCAVEDEELTEEEYDFIQENICVNVQVKLKEE